MFCSFFLSFFFFSFELNVIFSSDLYERTCKFHALNVLFCLVKISFLYFNGLRRDLHKFSSFFVLLFLSIKWRWFLFLLWILYLRTRIHTLMMFGWINAKTNRTEERYQWLCDFWRIHRSLVFILYFRPLKFMLIYWIDFLSNKWSSLNCFIHNCAATQHVPLEQKIFFFSKIYLSRACERYIEIGSLWNVGNNNLFSNQNQIKI